MAVTVIPAGIVAPREDHGGQVKVHKGQVIASNLGMRKQSKRDRLRRSYFLYSLLPT